MAPAGRFMELRMLCKSVRRIGLAPWPLPPVDVGLAEAVAVVVAGEAVEVVVAAAVEAAVAVDGVEVAVVAPAVDREPEAEVGFEPLKDPPVEGLRECQNDILMINTKGYNPTDVLKKDHTSLSQKQKHIIFVKETKVHQFCHGNKRQLPR